MIIERTALERMLEARSVAVVGASVKAGTLGATMMAELLRGGYDGAVFPVNPRYDEIDGYRCFPSLLDVPEPPDLAILGLANARVEAALRDAAERGAASAVTFASLYEASEDRPSGDARPLADRLRAIAMEHGMAMCGGNGMGFLNLESRVRATGFPTPDNLRPGPVTFLSHSGSAFAALAFNDRGIGFNLVVSSGQEVVTTMADYMEYALALDSTRVLALLLETVRDPLRFRHMLARAAERDVPVLALKVGRTEGSKAMVAAHSGALAGEHGAYEAVFDAYGVLEVQGLDEMVDAIELFSAPRRAASGRGVASLHDSGGERALFVDIGQDLGLPFAEVSETTLRALDDVLDPGLEAANPLDAWGTGIDADRIFRESLLILHDDPDTAAMAFVVDLTRQGEPYDEGYLQVARDVWSETTKPVCIVSNLASAVAHDEVMLLRDAGIPVLEGTRSGLVALRALLELRDLRARPSLEDVEPVSPAIVERWIRRVVAGGPFSELEALSLLADYGVSTIVAGSASTPDDAVDVAARVGYPVVLKTAAPGIQHKSDVGGVVLRLDSDASVRHAYADMAARLGPNVTVAATAPAGVEMALGMVRDEIFGPLVLVAAGGVLVELQHDRRLGLPPLDAARSRRLVDGLAARPLLDGVRGAAPASVDALARALSRMSVLANDLGEHLEAVDVNPVIVSASGCVAVDALVVPHDGGGPRPNLSVGST
jgi:acyl-CoA synthetase (NDP forming)